MQTEKVDFNTALLATRAGNLFTTHTPVEAGFDRFDNQLVEHYLSSWTQSGDINISHILALGHSSEAAVHDPFNMAWLAIHGSIAVNGVTH